MRLPFASLGAVVFLFCTSARADSANRAKFSPYPKDGYPQVIQKHDYPTISFIESLYRSLLKISAGKQTEEEFGRAVDCEVAANALTFRPHRGAATAVVVQRPNRKTILIGDAQFTNQPTTVFCSRLLTILNDFTDRSKCRGVRLVQFGTRAYKKRTIIEFDFGPDIVVIDSFSNGPKDEERLYILDVVQRKESMFWSRERA